MKVLVFSHDTGTARAYMAIAKSGGWAAMTCADDPASIAAIRDAEVDAVVFDYSPGFGLEALHRIRQAGLHLPTILITTHPVDDAEMMALGVKVILPKPPDVLLLREALSALTAAPAPEPSDMKVLFQFLERCDSAHRHRGSANTKGE